MRKKLLIIAVMASIAVSSLAYAWGYDKTDLGHVYDMTADPATLQIVIDHCF